MTSPIRFRHLAQFFILTVIILGGPLSAKAEETFRTRVTAVLDGDTIKVEHGRRPVTIRLFGIDCPELKKQEGERTQPYGLDAKKFLEDKILGRTVTVTIYEKIGRRFTGLVVSEEGVNMNRLLLKEGFAWWYHQYCRQAEWAADETDARINRRGLWKDPNPVPPWVFRHKGYLERDGKL